MEDGGDPCGWASSSLFKKVKHLLGLKRLKSEYPILVELSIPAGIGKHFTKGKRQHVDFWLYTGNCLTNHVVSVRDTRQDG